MVEVNRPLTALYSAVDDTADLLAPYKSSFFLILNQMTPQNFLCGVRVRVSEIFAWLGSIICDNIRFRGFNDKVFHI